MKVPYEVIKTQRKKTMNYSNLFKQFKKELFSKVQYTRLDSPFKAFAFVAAFPFWFMYAVILGFNYVNLFLFNCFASSADYLEGWVKETKKDVQHASEAVIFFVTTPFIFFLRCLLSIFSIFFYMMWFFAMCFGYIASLAAVRWQPFISYAEYDEELEIKAVTKKMVGNVIAVIGFSVFCLGALIYLVGILAEDFDTQSVGGVILGIHALYMAIAVPITFKKKICLASECENSEEAQPEKNVFEEEFPEI